MLLLIVNLSEFGQLLQIVLWIFIPAAIISILASTLLHYRRKSRLVDPVEWENGEERANTNGEEAGLEEPNPPYRGYLWMKAKYETLLEATDGRYFEMKERLGLEMAKVREQHMIIVDLNTTIADLTARLEASRQLLLNIHNEMGANPGATGETPAGAAEQDLTPATPTEAAGPGEFRAG